MTTNLEFILDVTPDEGEPYRLICRSRVLGAWEQMFRGASLSNLAQPTVSDLQAIAFVGATKGGQFTGNLNTFREHHEVDMKSELDLIVETELAARIEEARANGETFSDSDAARWEKKFRKDWEDGDDGEDRPSVFMGGPTG